MWFPLLVLLSLSVLYAAGGDPLVLTNAGWVRGLQATDGDYHMYMGIPFAKVNPENPFGDAVSPSKFEGVFDAFDDSAVCPQIEEFNNTIIGTLDCLRVNVYVPNSALLDPSVRLPVLVWVYGGGFQIGLSGRFLHGPKYLVRHDVILVTFNYRIGPYGFMCLDIPEVPGNQGLKDQQLAFAWIKENIASFGGDPDRITVSGESAGAISIDLHLMFHDLPFRNAILHSGTASMTGLIQDSNPDIALRIAEQIGLTPQNVHEALEVLVKLQPASVIDAANKIGVAFWPCVEKQFQDVKNFMTDFPVNIDVLKVNGMNILVGFNDDEWIISYVFGSETFYLNWDMIRNNLKTHFVFENPLREELAQIIKQFYIGDQDLSESVKWDLADYQADWMTLHPTERAINKYLKSGVGKVYYNMFSYTGERNFVKRRFNITERGAAHADELGYLFDMQLDVITEPPTPDDQLILDRMTTLWTNFVKYDDPTPQLDSLLPVKWEPVSSDSPRYYMNIDLNMTLSQTPFNRRMRFWDLFFNKYGKYEKGYRETSDSNACKNFKSSIFLLLSFPLVVFSCSKRLMMIQ